MARCFPLVCLPLPHGVVHSARALHLPQAVPVRLLISAAARLPLPQQRLRVILSLKSRAFASLQLPLACVRYQDTMIRLGLSQHRNRLLS
jgi:ABC-type arginine/histidine transport system permease subunit